MAAKVPKDSAPDTVPLREPGKKPEVFRDLTITSWRYDRLTDAGYPVDAALLLSERHDIDLHKACNLLRDGATVHQALNILT